MNTQQINNTNESYHYGEHQDCLDIESSEQIYRPNQSARKSKNLFRKKGKKNGKMSKFNNSLWTLQENIAYKEFLEANGYLFEKDREGRKILKINVLMSRAVKTRSADQCRSHHQKMMKYHCSIGQIIDHVHKLMLSKDEVDDSETLVRTPNKEIKTQLIDFTQYQGFLKFGNEERDIVQQFLTFS